MSTINNIERTAAEALHCKTIVRQQLLQKVQGASAGEKPPSQHPVISRIYYFRSLLMHRMINDALTVLDSLSYSKSQLLVLGAGKDDSYAQRFSSTHSVFSVDLPSVIADRCSSSNSIFIAADLRDTPLLNEALCSVGFVLGNPTVVVLECVLCYIQTEDVVRLLTYLSKSLTISTLLLYDPLFGSEDLSDRNGFLTLMKSKFHSRGAPILFHMKDSNAYITFLRRCGWRYSLSEPMSRCINIFATESDVNVSSLLGPFDEAASLALLHSCYHITCAASTPAVYSRIKAYMDESYILGKTIFQDYSITYINGNELILRRARPEDKEEAVALYYECFKEYASKTPSIAKFLKKAASDLMSMIEYTDSKGSNIVLIAEDPKVEGAVQIGIICIKSDFGGNGEMVHMCVHSSWRRHGLARAMLREVLCRSVPLKLSRVNLTTLLDMDAARGLYTSEGFRVVKEEYCKGSNLIHMLKELKHS